MYKKHKMQVRQYDNIIIPGIYTPILNNINGGYSSISNVNVGVPQGSSLGPLFFLIFVNELVKICRYCKTILYADDSVIYHSGDSLNDVQDRVNEDLALISQWSRANGLTLNVEKTKYVGNYKNSY
jgi:hypothetical protein